MHLPKRATALAQTGEPLAWKLAAYNGIKNANLIYPGQKVTIPDRSLL